MGGLNPSAIRLLKFNSPTQMSDGFPFGLKVTILLKLSLQTFFHTPYLQDKHIFFLENQMYSMYELNEFSPSDSSPTVQRNDYI